MKLSFGNVKKAIYICAALLFLVCIHVVSVYVFAVHRFSISYDPIITAQARDDIDHYIQEKELYKLPSGQLDRSLKAAFPSISSITCRRRPDNVLELSLKAAEPHIVVGDDYLVTVDNYLVPYAYYEKEETGSLPIMQGISEMQDQRLPSHIFAYVQKLDRALLKEATILWKHSNEILITMKEPRLKLICNEYIIPTKELLDCCATIAHEIKAQSSSVQSLLADVRFADQIIVSKIKG